MKNKGGKRINQNSHKWPWALVAALAQFTTRVCRDTESIPTASPWNHTKQTVPSPARDTRDCDRRGGRRFTGLKRAGTTGQSLLFHDIQNPWQPKIQGTGNQVPRLVLAWGLLHSSLQLPSSKGKFSNTAKHKVKPKTGCPHLLSHQTLKGISLSISSSQHCILSVISAGPDKGWTPGCWNKHSCRERAVRGTGQLGKVGRELLCCWISAGNRTADTLTTEQVSTLSHASPYTYIPRYPGCFIISWRSSLTYRKHQCYSQTGLAGALFMDFRHKKLSHFTAQCYWWAPTTHTSGQIPQCRWLEGQEGQCQLHSRACCPWDVTTGNKPATTKFIWS